MLTHRNQCKADVAKHRSQSHSCVYPLRSRWRFAHASFLSRYDVLAIAVSGQTKANVRISHFLCPKESAAHCEYFGSDILTFEEYSDSFQESNQVCPGYNALLEYTRSLNETLHNKKVKESQRSLLISGILIALQNKGFQRCLQIMLHRNKPQSFWPKLSMTSSQTPISPQDKLRI